MARRKLPVTIDFETKEIEPRPNFPPNPVGVSIKLPGRKSKYYAWGHPTKNNCSVADGYQALTEVWDHREGLLFHNGKFDLQVASAWFGLAVPEWDRIHDTLFMLFLTDPHARSLELKPASETLLGLPPEEQDAVYDWLLDHHKDLGFKVTKAKGGKRYFGKYISEAPGNIVGKYAEGDTDRTQGLFQHLSTDIYAHKLDEAYDRERELLPIIISMEQQGVHVDVERLSEDVRRYDKCRVKLNSWIRKRLKVGESTNLNSGEQLVEALDRAKAIDLHKLPLTPTGKYQSNNEALMGAITDARLLNALTYRSKLNTSMETFMFPWLNTAASNNGVIFTQWNQTRAPAGDGSIGSRTGRLSSTPNLQNIPKAFEPLFYHQDRSKKLPKAPFPDILDLPKIRTYIQASPGYVLLGRDFSSQELRMLAHFEQHKMLKAFIEDPELDLHAYAAELISSVTGLQITRRHAKTIAFALLYGAGLAKLAAQLGCTVNQAKMFKSAYLNTFPGIKQLQDGLKNRAVRDLPIRTYGGREYYCEPPALIKGRIRRFEYKLLNYLIQGSSADQTKEAVIKFHNCKTNGRILLLVHDEVVVEAPKKEERYTMEILKKSMDESSLTCPCRSTGEIGQNWGFMQDFM